MKRLFAFILVLVLALALCACDSADYKKAIAAYAAGDYEGAKVIFTTLGDYEDSAAMLNACNYEIAVKLMDEDKLEDAIALFEALGDYKDSAEKIQACNYEIACQLLEEGKLEDAKAMFEALGDYEDSAEQLEACMIQEIDLILQGDWQAVEGIIVFDYTFNSGRFDAKLSVSGSSIANEGSYRIDPSAKEIYVCYDYINSSTGKTPNTEEQLLFTYTYEDGEFKLMSTVDMEVKKK